MASVSSVARLYLGGFSGCRRSSHSRSSGRLCTRQPVARQTSSMPLFSHSQAISCSSWRMVSASSMSSNSARISRNGSGCAAQSRAVSSMRLACVEFIRARGQVWLSQFGAEGGAKTGLLFQLPVAACVLVAGKGRPMAQMAACISAGRLARHCICCRVMGCCNCRLKA